MQILNISGNNIESLSEVGCLTSLDQLLAKNNNLNDMKEMSVLLKCWPRLSILDLSGNPICGKNKYRERIIVQSASLKVLDGKEIAEMSRQFLENWKLSKEMSIQRGNMINNKQEFSGILEHDESDGSSARNGNTFFNAAELGKLTENKLNKMPTYIMPGTLLLPCTFIIH